MRLGYLLLAFTVMAACDRAETRTSPVTTTSPAGTSTAPSSAAANSRAEALVRAVHAIPAGAVLDVFAGDLMIFDGVGFKAVTNYRALDGKRYSFALRPAGMTTAKPLSSNTEGLSEGHYYTAFALPGDGRAARLRIVGDNLDRPAAGKARLRIVHAGADTGEIDVRAGGHATALFEGVDFQAITDYREVDPINGPLTIHGDGRPAPVVTLPTVHIEAGRFYTVVLVGSVRSTPRLEAFIIEDALAPPRGAQ